MPSKQQKKSKLQVWRGNCAQTCGGLRKGDIIRKQTGKGYRYVSKKKSERARNHPWMQAVKAARLQLGITGFVKIKRGDELHTLAKDIMTRLLASPDGCATVKVCHPTPAGTVTEA